MNRGFTDVNLTSSTIKFVSIGTGIGPTLAAQMYTDIHAYQTTLSRQN
jgi:hypothetical protein